MSDCSLLNHFLSSYQKNYTPNLETIAEEETLLEDSVRDFADSLRLRQSTSDSQLTPKMRDQLRDEYRAVNKPNEKKKNNVSKLGLLKDKISIKKYPRPTTVVSQTRPLSKDKASPSSKNDKLIVSIEQLPVRNRISHNTRSKSPVVTQKIEKSVKRNGINNRTVKQILEGMNLDKQKLDEFIKSQGFKPINEAAAKITNGLLSKKDSKPKLSTERTGSRGSSRKLSSSRTKCSSPHIKQSQTERTRERASAESGGQSLNIKIENKDFVARMMNINIIKIKPDICNNPCFCKQRFDKPGERKKSTKALHNLSSDIKSRCVSAESKSSRNKSSSAKCEENIARNKHSRPKKSVESHQRNFIRKDSSNLQ